MLMLRNSCHTKIPRADQLRIQNQLLSQLPPPAPRCLVHVVSVGSCWTWHQSSTSCPTHSTSSLKIFTSAFWDPRDCHSAAKYHSSSPGCCTNVTCSSMQRECSLTFRWWKWLEMLKYVSNCQQSRFARGVVQKFLIKPSKLHFWFGF